MHKRVIWSLVIVLAGSVASADEPAKPKIEELPFPRQLPTPGPVLMPPVVTSDYLPYYLPSSQPQPGTREVWQYYAVDSRGRWVPRVILSPTGAYYYGNGVNFPFTTTRPNVYMPYVLD